MTEAQSLSILHNFGSVPHDGSAPTQVVLGIDGNYYGISSSGGSAGYGAVYQMTPAGSVTVLHSFADGSVASDGKTPVGLMLATDGNFYGTTSAGGSQGDGTVFQMTPAGAMTILHSFGDGTVSEDGATPAAGLVEASDGNLYGTTSAGGAGPNYEGTVFEISLQGAVTILHTFGDGTTADDGSDPVAPLVQGSDGNLYGTTKTGGGSNVGTVFEVLTDLFGYVETVYSFSGTDGANPNTGLVQNSDGLFYGTTSSGGSTNTGTIFKVSSSGAETTLYNFNSNNGAPYLGQSPTTGLLLAGDGNFYGVTPALSANGTATSSGTVFEMTPQGTVSFIHLFGDETVANDGANPGGLLIQGSDGNLVGTTQAGGTGSGTVFTLQPALPALTSALTFSGTVGTALSYQITAANVPTGFAASSNLPAGLSLDPSTGLITGTPTASGTYAVTLTLSNFFGSNTATVTFNIAAKPVPTITSVLNAYTSVGASFSYTITATNNATSYAISGQPAWLSINTSTGVLSGTPTSVANGSSALKVALLAYNTAGHSNPQFLTINVLSSAPTLGQEYSVLYRFQAGSDGSSPIYSSLVQGLDGTFYGVATGGGDISSRGTAYNINIQGMSEIIHRFGISGVFDDGTQPHGTMILAADGNFYGTCSSGGTAAMGVVFKMSPSGTEAIIHNFGDGTVVFDGAQPEGALCQGSDGNFYGTTTYGGKYNEGTLFRLTPQGSLTILHSFNDPVEGDVPYGNLVEGSDGLFYGVDLGGPTGDGAIFSISTQGAFSVVHSFAGTDGASVPGSLVQASDGNFYGETAPDSTTPVGFGGAIYRLTPQGGFSSVYTFGAAANDGSSPIGGLIQGLDGNLYGETYLGGSVGKGTIFQATMGGVETILHNFSDGSISQDGVNPTGGLYQGSDGNFYGTTTAGGVNGNGVVFTIQANQTPAIAPTVVGSTTVFAPTNQPLFYAAQALQSQASVSGASGSLTTRGSSSMSSLFAEAISFFTPNLFTTNTTAPTSWILTGSAPPNLSFNSSSGTLTGQVVASSGMYTFDVQPENSYAVGTQKTITMYVESAPTITSQVTDTPTQGVPYSYQVAVADYDFPIAYSATHLPSWLSIDPVAGAITGIPPGPGTYVFNPVATNLAGSTGLQVTLNVAGNSSAPVISSSQTTNATVGAPYSYTITASNNPTVFTALTMPPGLIFNQATGTIMGTPTTPGTYQIPMTASNSSGIGASVLALTIAPVAAPMINGPLSVSAPINVAFSYQIPAVGIVSTYASGTLPAGLTLNTTTGVISGTPTAAGSSNVIVSASNGTGPATATLTIAITTTVSVSQWESTYGITSLTATPQGDGVPNLLKYFYDINPTRPMNANDRAALPVIATSTVSDTTYLTITFGESQTETGLNFVVETSPNLISWTTLTSGQYTIQPTGAIDPNGDPYMLLTTPASGSKDFIRLNVSQ